MTNARASWNVICTQSVYLYNCPLFEATRVEYPLSDEKTMLTPRVHLCQNYARHPVEDPSAAAAAVP